MALGFIPVPEEKAQNVVYLHPWVLGAPSSIPAFSHVNPMPRASSAPAVLLPLLLPSGEGLRRKQSLERTARPGLPVRLGGQGWRAETGGGGEAHVAGVGLGVLDASTQHGFSQQLLVHLFAFTGGDEVHIGTHEFGGEGHCRTGKEGCHSEARDMQGEGGPCTAGLRDWTLRGEGLRVETGPRP